MTRIDWAKDRRRTLTKTAGWALRKRCRKRRKKNPARAGGRRVTHRAHDWAGRLAEAGVHLRRVGEKFVFVRPEPEVQKNRRGDEAFSPLQLLRARGWQETGSEPTCANCRSFTPAGARPRLLGMGACARTGRQQVDVGICLRWQSGGIVRALGLVCRGPAG